MLKFDSSVGDRRCPCQQPQGLSVCDTQAPPRVSGVVVRAAAQRASWLPGYELPAYLTGPHLDECLHAPLHTRSFLRDAHDPSDTDNKCRLA